ncbi:hypothetical protein, partial [Plesiomonas shigelloides]|uniref:hypothetical protein n=1 Tax=Plesiomonas shigelloides TaxID=703 RepID=UPI001E346B87
MQDHLIAQIDCGMIGRRATEVDKENIPRLGLVYRHLIETGINHIVQVQLSAGMPPIIRSLEVRQT